MARPDQLHDDRTEVVTYHQHDPDQPDQHNPDQHDPDRRNGYDDEHDPDRTQVVSGVVEPDPHQPVHREPIEQPTAFGAATVGGAVAASAMAGPERLHEPRDPRDEDTVRDGDGPLPDDSRAVPAVADADTNADIGDEETADDGRTAPVVGHLPTDMPTDVAVETPASFLASDEADAFRDRWRDVQLRFVDDPHAAAGEAQALTAEAVEALTAALTAHRDDLNGWTGTSPDDTEQLRLVVRRYRDLLDRLLAI
ncbi:hypothetical protein O7632_25450 [Solwaraspora sp. WMMD406]|uniref:hypothetical protein n=1 Tax=Solwaraspora sp. WMMD406 TaxID=3016095 RepID=UPI0024179287|nr:hypothetical protein [Solwaraspora sp. WMMD406]MDG4767410.1 hypothetical protein [Solwaraspora sp. WMMD406]